MEEIAQWLSLYKEAVAFTLLLGVVWLATRGLIFFRPERLDLIKQRDEANARADAKDKQYTIVMEKMLDVTKGWADAAREARR